MKNRYYSQDHPTITSFASFIKEIIDPTNIYKNIKTTTKINLSKQSIIIRYYNHTELRNQFFLRICNQNPRI